MRRIFKGIGMFLMIGGLLTAAIGFSAALPEQYPELMFVGGIISTFLGAIVLGIIVLKS
uniref:hypothetical protein n=1 Tax=Pedobacter schmidteae TaxID=2201271 RepID=UPI0013CED0B9